MRSHKFRTATVRVTTREVGGPPDLDDEAAVVAWLASISTSSTAAEIRADRRARLRRAGLIPTGDPDVDRVREHVAEALDGRARGPIPATSHTRRTTSGSTPRSAGRRRSTTSSGPAPSPAADRAARYGRRAR